MAKELQSPGAFLSLMLEKYRLSPSKLAQDIHLSQSAVRLITIGSAKITVPVAIRLAKYFNTNPEFWLAMQMKWDVAEISKDKALMKIVKSISRVVKGTAGGGKKTTPKKTAAKKPVAKKPAARKTTAKKPAVKKPVAKKTAVKKPARQARTKTAVRRGRPAAK